MSRFTDPASRVLPAPGDRVLVAGLGRSGVAAARALVGLGVSVAVCDDARDDATRASADSSRADEIVVGGMPPELLDGRDLVIASPGIRPSSPLIAAAFAAGIPVWSEVELGSRLTDAPLLGVTGTNGKTTTTEMLTACLVAGGTDAVAAGNIGLPLVEATQTPRAAYACELSSFQLHGIVSLRVRAGVLLNIAQDHLDWHGGFDAYAAAKGRMFENQRENDAAIVFDEPRCIAAATARRAAGEHVIRFSATYRPPGGAGIEDGWIVGPQGRVVAVADLRVRGSAMLADAVAAASAATAFGIRPEAVASALAAFEPAPHRMETIRYRDGVAYVNDSKATNPHAALTALSGLHRVVLIAGGRNKDLDLSPLGSAEAVCGVIAIGESAGEIEAAFAGRGVPVERAASMREAVERAAALAQAGDTVLLSPACASFDMFDDYKHRGDAFRTAALKLADAPTSLPASQTSHPPASSEGGPA